MTPTLECWSNCISESVQLEILIELNDQTTIATNLYCISWFFWKSIKLNNRPNAFLQLICFHHFVFLFTCVINIVHKSLWIWPKYPNSIDCLVYRKRLFFFFQLNKLFDDYTLENSYIRFVGKMRKWNERWLSANVKIQSETQLFFSSPFTNTVHGLWTLTDFWDLFHLSWVVAMLLGM